MSPQMEKFLQEKWETQYKKKTYFEIELEDNKKAMVVAHEDRDGEQRSPNLLLLTQRALSSDLQAMVLALSVKVVFTSCMSQ